MKMYDFSTIRDYAPIAADNAQKFINSGAFAFAAIEDIEKYLTLDLWGKSRNSEVCSSQLSMTAYSLWLAAVHMATVGHAAAVPALLRTSIESMSYAVLIANDHALGEVWGNRLLDGTGKNRFNSKFKNPIQKAEALTACRWVLPDNRIYNAYLNTIDFGAHPNAPLVSRNFLSMQQAEDMTWSGNYAILHEHPSSNADFGVLMCVDVGTVLCWLASTVFDDIGLLETTLLYDLEMKLQGVAGEHRKRYGAI